MEHLLIGAFSLPRVFTLLCLSIHVAFVNYVFMFRGIFTLEDFFDYSSIVLPLRRFYESPAYNLWQSSPFCSYFDECPMIIYLVYWFCM